MCGTLALDRLTTQAQAVGAKVLLAGDWAQLSAVESGGAFRMLENDRADVAELSTVRRFTNAWERTASIQLRIGDVRASDAYAVNGRIRGGAAEEMMDAAYTAWAGDERAGRSSLLIADTNASVAELNTRARTDRVAWGHVEQDGVRLHDGTVAGAGDRIVTRRIDRTLSTGPSSWVKNGDLWIVARRHADGGVAVRRANNPDTGVLTLPAAYAVARPEMSREVLYVAMTRARQSNTAYVCTDAGLDDEYGPDSEQPTVRDVLEQVLARTGAELSAHETIRAEHARVGSIAQLAAEYDTIAREARRQRWTALAQTCFPDADPAQLTRSDSWPGLVAGWQRADAAGLDLDTALPRLAANLLDAGDPVTVLCDRVHRWCEIAAPATPPVRTLIAGLIPAADYVADPAMRRALAERAALIEQRAEALVEPTITAAEPWLDRLGPRPNDPASRLQWERAATTVAAYRDRHGITDPADPFGEPKGGGRWTRRPDRQRAQTAVLHARRLAATQAERLASAGQQARPELRLNL